MRCTTIHVCRSGRTMEMCLFDLLLLYSSLDRGVTHSHVTGGQLHLAPIRVDERALLCSTERLTSSSHHASDISEQTIAALLSREGKERGFSPSLCRREWICISSAALYVDARCTALKETEDAKVASACNVASDNK